jgi:hypothetical protein
VIEKRPGRYIASSSWLRFAESLGRPSSSWLRFRALAFIGRAAGIRGRHAPCAVAAGTRSVPATWGKTPPAARLNARTDHQYWRGWLRFRDFNRLDAAAGCQFGRTGFVRAVYYQADRTPSPHFRSGSIDGPFQASINASIGKPARQDSTMNVINHSTASECVLVRMMLCMVVRFTACIITDQEPESPPR